MRRYTLQSHTGQKVFPGTHCEARGSVTHETIRTYHEALRVKRDTPRSATHHEALPRTKSYTTTRYAKRYARSVTNNGVLPTTKRTRSVTYEALFYASKRYTLRSATHAALHATERYTPRSVTHHVCVTHHEALHTKRYFTQRDARSGTHNHGGSGTLPRSIRALL